LDLSIKRVLDFKISAPKSQILLFPSRSCCDPIQKPFNRTYKQNPELADFKLELIDFSLEIACQHVAGRRRKKIEKSDAGNTKMTAARDARDEVWSRRRQVSQNGK
jgi:hypothetical protein